jgi:aryl carrier-like protein
MKQSDLKRIIKEEVHREQNLNEGILDSLIMMFLSPKIKREANTIKNSPDWKELVQKINTTRDEMEMYNKRFEKYLAQCKKDVEAARKQGIKVKDCSGLEKYRKQF